MSDAPSARILRLLTTPRGIALDNFPPGAGESNHCILEEEGASLCMFIRHGDDILLRPDDGQPALLNGREVSSEVPLKSGDSLRLGGREYRILIVAASPVPEAGSMPGPGISGSSNSGAKSDSPTAPGRVEIPAASSELKSGDLPWHDPPAAMQLIEEYRQRLQHERDAISLEREMALAKLNEILAREREATQAQIDHLAALESDATQALLSGLTTAAATDESEKIVATARARLAGQTSWTDAKDQESSPAASGPGSGGLWALLLLLCTVLVLAVINLDPKVTPRLQAWLSRLSDQMVGPVTVAVMPTPAPTAQPEPAKPEPAKPEPAKPEPAMPEPAKPEPAKPEPAMSEPAKPEPAKPEPAKPEPAKPEPAKPEPAKPEPAKPEPAMPEPAMPEPAKPEPAKPEPALPGPALPEPAKPESAMPESAMPEPAKPEPAQPEPAQPEPAKPEPAEPEPAVKAPEAVKLPVPAVPAGPIEKEKIDACLDTLLSGATIRGLQVTIGLEDLGKLSELIDSQFTGRIHQNESVQSLLGLLRQANFVGCLPASLTVKITNRVMTQKRVIELLGPPGDTIADSAPVSLDGSTIYADRGPSLAPSRPTKVNIDGTIEVSFSRDKAAGSPAEGAAVRVNRLSYGYLTVAFAADASGPFAIQIDPKAFLDAHQSLPGGATVRSPKELRRFERGSKVWSLALSPDGRTIAVGQADAAIVLLNAESGEEIRRFTGHEAEVFALAFSPDGTRLVSGSNDRTARLWEIGTGTELKAFKAHSGGVTAVAFSADGKRVLTAGADMICILWDANSGDELKWLIGHEAGVTGAAISSDGRRAVTGSNDFTARVWDLGTGKEIMCLRGHEAGVQTVAMSPDGRYILTGSGGPLFDAANNPVPSLDATVRLWDTNTGEELRRFVGHSDWVICVAFSPNGKRVVSGSGGGVRDGKVTFPGRENNIRLWDVESGLEVCASPPQKSIIRSLAFSPDGKRLFSGSWDQTVSVWELPPP